MANNVRQTILEYQQKHNIPDFIMCNILCMDEPEWNKYKVSGRGTLTTFQKIMFIVTTQTPL